MKKVESNKQTAFRNVTIISNGTLVIYVTQELSCGQETPAECDSVCDSDSVF